MSLRHAKTINRSFIWRHETEKKREKENLLHSFFPRAGSLIYRLRAVDPDGDALLFGVREQPGSDVIRVKSTSKNEANVYLNKILDREVSSAYLMRDDKSGGPCSRRCQVGDAILSSLFVVIRS